MCLRTFVRPGADFTTFSVGWQTGWLPVALPLALAIEARILWRPAWTLDLQGINRFADLSSLALIAVGAWFLVTLEPPRAARTVMGMAQWLPLTLAPLAIAQAYFARGPLDLGVLLVTLRFVQGLGVGGEWGGAVLMAVEHGAAGKRGLHASWVQAGVPIGLLLATAVFNLFSALPEKDFLAWGWRVPFLLGILLTAVGLFIRLAIVESPVFAQMKAAKAEARLPILEVIQRHPRNVLLAMGARFAENASMAMAVEFTSLTPPR